MRNRTMENIVGILFYLAMLSGVITPLAWIYTSYNSTCEAAE